MRDGGGLFYSLNFLIIIWYIVQIYVQLYTKEILAEQKSYGFKNLVKLGVEIINFKITIGRTVFNFSCKTSVFAGMGALFE